MVYPMSKWAMAPNEKIDYTQVVLWQINDIRQSDTDFNVFINKIKTLDTLLCPYYDADYTEGVGEVLKDGTTISKEKAHEILKELILLFHRSGFIAPKEAEGVISKFDGKVIEELINLERQGKTEVTKAEFDAIVESATTKLVKGRVKYKAQQSDLTKLPDKDTQLADEIDKETLVLEKETLVLEKTVSEKELLSEAKQSASDANTTATSTTATSESLPISEKTISEKTEAKLTTSSNTSIAVQEFSARDAMEALTTKYGDVSNYGVKPIEAGSGNMIDIPQPHAEAALLKDDTTEAKE